MRRSRPKLGDEKEEGCLAFRPPRPQVSDLFATSSSPSFQLQRGTWTTATSWCFDQIVSDADAALIKTDCPVFSLFLQSSLCSSLLLVLILTNTYVVQLLFLFLFLHLFAFLLRAGRGSVLVIKVKKQGEFALKVLLAAEQVKTSDKADR